jgi:hypothetical protein
VAFGCAAGGVASGFACGEGASDGALCGFTTDEFDAGCEVGKGSMIGVDRGEYGALFSLLLAEWPEPELFKLVEVLPECTNVLISSKPPASKKTFFIKPFLINLYYPLKRPKNKHFI